MLFHITAKDTNVQYIYIFFLHRDSYLNQICHSQKIKCCTTSHFSSLSCDIYLEASTHYLKNINTFVTHIQTQRDTYSWLQKKIK